MYVETIFDDFPKSSSDSLLTECEFVVNYYKSLFGGTDSTYLKFIIVPFEGGGYSRKNCIVMRSKKFDLHLKRGIGHEIAHFWWSNANVTSWEDWLNESFAEYSMLMYLRERFGQDVFDGQIEGYKTNVANTPPVWGIDRNAKEAYTVLYEKGSLILYELEQKMGQVQFNEMLKSVAENEVKTTEELLGLLEKKYSKELRDWLVNALKTK
jgi:hypothetical protein